MPVIMRELIAVVVVDIELLILSGKRLARYLDRSPARFQPLPIGTAREVFPQAARPVGFISRVMGR